MNLVLNRICINQYIIQNNLCQLINFLGFNIQIQTQTAQVVILNINQPTYEVVKNSIVVTYVIGQTMVNILDYNINQSYIIKKQLFLKTSNNRNVCLYMLLINNKLEFIIQRKIISTVENEEK